MTTQTATRHMGESRVDRVKSRFDLAEIVRRHGVALREGHRYSMGRCPFHDDSTPSFMVVNAERRYYCFGCGAAGDVIDFVKQACNLGSVKDVLDTLEGPTYRSSASAKPLPPPRKPEPPRERTPAERAVLLTYTKIAHATLMRSRQAVAGRNYLAERGVTTETARKIRLGFGLRGDLMAELVAAGHEPEAVRGSGVLICPKEEEGKPPRDPWPRFSRMITIPDVTSEGVGFIAGRGVGPAPTYKFQNIPGGKPVLGLARLRERKTSWCLVTEGLFDYITLAQWNLPACAIMGPQRSESRADQFDGFTHVFTAMDADERGQEFAENLVEALGEDRVAPVQLPFGAGDVGDLATVEAGRAAFRSAMAAAAGRKGWESPGRRRRPRARV